MQKLEPTRRWNIRGLCLGLALSQALAACEGSSDESRMGESQASTMDASVPAAGSGSTHDAAVPTSPPEAGRHAKMNTSGPMAGAPGMQPMASAPSATAMAAGGSSQPNGAGAPTVAPMSAASAAPTKPLDWQPCAAEGFDCATLEVPVDYAQPTKGSFQLAVKRRRALGQRLGVLAVNFGGPGVSGVQVLERWAMNAGKDLNQRFDLVAFDPRGVGLSKPLIDCRDVHGDPGMQQIPDTQAAWMQLDQSAKQYAEQCAAKNAELLSHVGTWDGARDLDRLREAMGEATLSYYGVSYGTALGSRYAELFPRNVRAMVLDASMNDGLPRVELNLQEGKATELALGHFFSWCDSDQSRCSTWTYGQPAAQAWKRIEERVSAGQVRFQSGDLMTLIGWFTDVRGVLTGGLPGWQALSKGLGALANGNADQYAQDITQSGASNKDDTYDNSSEAFTAISCFDMPVESSDAVYAQLERYRVDLPHFGLLRVLDAIVCAHWPAKDTANAQRIPHAAGAAPIVVIGTSGDPATPYDWSVAQEMHFESAVLLTHRGEGHGAFGTGSICIDNAVNDYLIAQIVPKDRTTCAGAGSAERMLLPAPRTMR